MATAFYSSSSSFIFVFIFIISSSSHLRLYRIQITLKLFFQFFKPMLFLIACSRHRIEFPNLLLFSQFSLPFSPLFNLSKLCRGRGQCTGSEFRYPISDGQFYAGCQVLGKAQCWSASTMPSFPTSGTKVMGSNQFRDRLQAAGLPFNCIVDAGKSEPNNKRETRLKITGLGSPCPGNEESQAVLEAEYLFFLPLQLAVVFFDKLLNLISKTGSRSHCSTWTGDRHTL